MTYQTYLAFLAGTLFSQFLQETHGYCLGNFVREDCDSIWGSCPAGFAQHHETIPHDVPNCYCVRDLTSDEIKERTDCVCSSRIRSCNNPVHGGSQESNAYPCMQAVRDCPDETRALICSGTEEYRRYAEFCPKKLTTDERLEACVKAEMNLCYRQTLNMADLKERNSYLDYCKNKLITPYCQKNLTS